MRNREYVKNTYDEIHAPDARFRKVKNMNKKELKFRKERYVVATLAICAVLFATSNGICYAATGESLVEKAVLYINGEKADGEWKQEGEKLIYETSIDPNADTQNEEYRIEVDEDAAESVEVRVEEDEVNIEIYETDVDAE